MRPISDGPAPIASDACSITTVEKQANRRGKTHDRAISACWLGLPMIGFTSVNHARMLSRIDAFFLLSLSFSGTESNVSGGLHNLGATAAQAPAIKNELRRPYASARKPPIAGPTIQTLPTIAAFKPMILPRCCGALSLRSAK